MTWATAILAGAGLIVAVLWWWGDWRMLVTLIAAASLAAFVATVVLSALTRQRDELRQVAQLAGWADKKLQRIELRQERAIQSHDELVGRVDAIDTTVRALPRQAAEAARAAVARDMNALIPLHVGAGARVDVSGYSSWSTRPEVLNALTHIASALPANSTIVECGSGVSTVWLAHTVESENLRIRVVSLEHDAAWAKHTESMLQRNHLGASVDLRVAPLTPCELDDWSGVWYDPAAIDDLSDVSLLLIDGPPGTLGPLARYPAFPLLKSAFLDGAIIVLDDVDRDDERETLARWTRGGSLQEERSLDRAVVLRHQAGGRA